MSGEQSNSDSNYENSNPNSNETDEPIYVMTLELEKGRAEQIKIYADSDSNELAYAFCREHDLDFSALEYLKERIESLLNQIRERTDSQGSQIEEVDDEHINTEDNKYKETENKNQWSQSNNQQEYITDQNEREREKEIMQKENENIGKIQKDVKKKEAKKEKETENNLKSKHNAISIENEGNADEFNTENKINQINSDNKLIDEQNINNTDEELNAKNCGTDEDNKGTMLFNKKEENEEEHIVNNEIIIENNLSQDNEEQEIDQKKKEEEVEVVATETIEKEEDKNQLLYNKKDTGLFNKEYTEKNINSKKAGLHIDPYCEQVNQEQLELENDIDFTSSLYNENNESPKEILPEQSKFPKKQKKEIALDEHDQEKQIQTKTPLFQTFKTQEQKNVYIHKNQAHSSEFAPISSTQQNEVKSHKNYFRATKPIFSQNIQSTLNTKPQTQTEQKSTSHSPPQSNTTNPTLNNNYTIKPLIKTPTNQKGSNQIPQINFEKKENEDEKNDIPLQSNSIHFHRYYSYLSKKQLNNSNNIFDRLFKEAEIKRILPYCYNSTNNNNKNAINQEKACQFQTIKSKQDSDKPPNMNYGEYLYSKDKMMKEEKEKQISQIKEYQAQQEIYSFKPTIASEHRLNSNLSNPSFQRIDKIERMKKELSEVYTFKPKVNGNYNTELSFNDRQDFFANLYKQRNQELNQIIHAKHDEKGNVLFHPQLISKQTEVQETEVNRFDKNYNYAIQYRKNKQELSNKIFEEKKKVVVYKNSQTSKIIILLHKEAFGKLFHELNNNQDGKLTPYNLTTKKTPQNILAIINPLLFELKEDNQTLNEEEFLSSMEQLFKEISVIEQRLLINTYKRQNHRSKSKGIINERNNHSYKPVINSNTSKLAKKYDTKIAERYPGIIGPKKNIVNRGDFFKLESKKTVETIQTFTNIHNYTFDNYVKKLN